MKEERRVSLGSGTCKPEYYWGEAKETFQILEEKGLLGLTGFSGDLEKVCLNLAQESGLPSGLGLCHSTTGSDPCMLEVRARRGSNSITHMAITRQGK